MAKYKLGPIFETTFPITQPYGVNPDYYKQFGLPGHEGVDVGTPNSTPVISPFNGVILRDTSGNKDYGNFVVVWDSVQQCAVWFCHLQDFATNIGDKVTAGQLLGHTDNTGNTTGPHCHVNFVETDANANRLNTDNGYQGFLNILDVTLVSFSPSMFADQAPTSPTQPIPTTTPNYSWPMAIMDIYMGLTDQKPTTDELNFRLNQLNTHSKTVVDIINDIASGDSRFQKNWVQPAVDKYAQDNPINFNPQTPLGQLLYAAAKKLG